MLFSTSQQQQLSPRLQHDGIAAKTVGKTRRSVWNDCNSFFPILSRSSCDNNCDSQRTFQSRHGDFHHNRVRYPADTASSGLSDLFGHTERGCLQQAIRRLALWRRLRFSLLVALLITIQQIWRYGRYGWLWGLWK